ncbi:hypothetical protein PFISCL1PPCAC_27201, partial [Pristionchus fissidentatus]
VLTVGGEHVHVHLRDYFLLCSHWKWTGHIGCDQKESNENESECTHRQSCNLESHTGSHQYSSPLVTFRQFRVSLFAVLLQIRKRPAGQQYLLL